MYRLKHKLKILSLLLLSCSLIACSSNEEDINEFIANTKKNTLPYVEKIPDLGKIASAKYQVGKLHSPFYNGMLGTPKLDTTGSEETHSSSAPAPSLAADVQILSLNKTPSSPDKFRKKEFLESFPLASLKMIGTLGKGKNYWALIVDATNRIHIVGKDDYLGENSGKVIQINENSTTLQELIPDGQGGWITRNVSINLTVKGT